VEDYQSENSTMTTSFQTVLLVLMILVTVLLYALIVIVKRQEAITDELLRRSVCMQSMLELDNPKTRSQGVKLPLGSGNSMGNG
jgi:hypothetical protein